ncbi:MAG TPA: SdpI family protein [Chitinophagaceae bacterium]|nr:SdpI family protein [Chitinophagaceae bacterium]
MKHSVILRWIFVLVLLSIPWIYLATIWGAMPESIPVHFGINGTPDKYGEKNQVLVFSSIITGIALLMYLILTNIYKIDPKRYATKQQGVFLKIAMVMVVFLSFVNVIILRWTIQQHTGSLNLFLVAIGLLFAYFGNIMHSIKPNYFAGLRLPWTLESETNWKATHQFASKIWFAGGILIALLALFIKPMVMFFVLMGIILIMVIIPMIYSYRYFKKEKAGQVQ